MMGTKITRLESFVKGSAESPFPIYNLPYGVFRTKNNTPRIGTAIGDYVLDLALLEKEGLLQTNSKHFLFNRDSLNLFASQGQEIWSAVRRRIQSLLT